MVREVRGNLRDELAEKRDAHEEVAD